MWGGADVEIWLRRRPAKTVSTAYRLAAAPHARRPEFRVTCLGLDRYEVDAAC